MDDPTPTTKGRSTPVLSRAPLGFLRGLGLAALGLAAALLGLAQATGAQTKNAQTTDAERIVAAAIAHHDPEGAWSTGTFRLTFEESRPDGPPRHTFVVIDNARGRFEIERQRDERRIEGELSADDCLWRLDGSADFSAEEREEFGLTCERLELWRNYYTYLWGMPMKLRDPGTVIADRAKKTEFEGRPAWEVGVTYAEGVGSDVWYFYFDPGDQALIGYRFYHDEAVGDGEYIVLEGVQDGAGLLLPKSRAWYTHQDRKHLGTDTVVSIEAAIDK